MAEEIGFENIWMKYGLEDTPYNTEALSLIGKLHIEKVFCGRKTELKIIGNRVFSNDSTRMVIAGEIGTGKTTFVNHLRWRLCCKNDIKKSRFLTTVKEIKIRSDWDFNKFLRETLFEIYFSSKIFKWDEQGIVFKTLKKIEENLNNVGKRSFEISEKKLKIGDKKDVNSQIPSELLQSWFYELCEEIRNYGKSLVLHYNNLESIEPEKLKNLFMSIKEIIQISSTHWLFLGPPDILSIIENIPQIHSIFNKHLVLESLSSKDVLSILKLRCEFLSKEGTRYIKPYDEKTVLELYKKLNGNIRFIFRVLEDTTSCLSHEISSPCTINIDEINIIQEKERKKILSKLTENQQRIIALMMESKEITPTAIAKMTGIKFQNVAKEIEELKSKGLIITKQNPEDRRSKLHKLSERTYLSFVFSQTEKKNRKK